MADNYNYWYGGQGASYGNAESSNINDNGYDQQPSGSGYDSGYGYGYQQVTTASSQFIQEQRQQQQQRVYNSPYQPAGNNWPSENEAQAGPSSASYYNQAGPANYGPSATAVAGPSGVLEPYGSGGDDSGSYGYGVPTSDISAFASVDALQQRFDQETGTGIRNSIEVLVRHAFGLRPEVNIAVELKLVNVDLDSQGHWSFNSRGQFWKKCRSNLWEPGAVITVAGLLDGKDPINSGRKSVDYKREVKENYRGAINRFIDVLKQGQFSSLYDGSVLPPGIPLDPNGLLRQARFDFIWVQSGNCYEQQVPASIVYLPWMIKEPGKHPTSYLERYFKTDPNARGQLQNWISAWGLQVDLT
ncbi:hypothetical protein F4677DRAFT_448990 [Hypoxylon crocopeplum]|nr:hypothetical protein F4677DRAFT_448990 [Hypoxylon crocopeplum]